MPLCNVKSSVVDEEINSKSGAVIRSQMVGLDLGNGHALPFKVGLGNRPAYKAGQYDIDPRSFGLDQYGNLTLKRYVDLVPVGAMKAG